MRTMEQQQERGGQGPGAKETIVRKLLINQSVNVKTTLRYVLKGQQVRISSTK